MRRACFVALAAAMLTAWVSPSPAATSVASDVTQITVAAAPPSFGMTAVDSLSGRFVQRVRICPPQGCFDPPRPICAGDSILVFVEGMFPSGCYRPTGIDLYIPPWASARMALPWVRILYDDHTCEGPCPTVLVPLRARIKLPPMRAGTYPLTVALQPAGCDTLLLPLDPVAFTVVDSCDTLPPPPNTLPHVDTITICSSDGPCAPICPGDSIAVRVAGTFPSDCYSLKRIDILPSLLTVVPTVPQLRIVVENGCCYGRPCLVGPKPWDALVTLPPTGAAGNAVLTVQMAELCCTDVVPPVPLPTAQYPFAIARDCAPPPPDSLPFVDRVAFCRDLPPDSGIIACEPLCTGDSVVVALSGRFPSDCYILRRVDVLPPPPSFREAAPHLRLVVDNRCCLDRLCLPDPTPWHALVKLPPMSAGPYDLKVMVAEVCCTDSVPAGELPAAHYPFAVSDSCDAPPPEACLWGGWMHADHEACDAYLAPGSTATVTFGINSDVPLAGLQGEFQMAWPVPASLDDPRPGPVISRIVPVRAAAGMRLSWTATQGGARFVLFADDGTVIPASPPFAGPRLPILAVTVALPAGSAIPKDIAVTAYDLLGADARGGAVPTCPVRADERLAFDRARICAGVGCDFNGDGVPNVRDLVTMVLCLRSNACPNTARFDCDRDGGFDLDDVLCCAWHVLRRPPCPGCAPDTTPPRKEDGVRLVLDAPVTAGGDVQAGLRIAGADRVGGARLELRFPTDRYEFVSLDGIGADWLALSEVRDGALVVGLIRIAETDGGLARQSLSVNGTLRLRLKPGMSPGGELVAAAAEFSGPDGAPLAVEASGASLPLSGGMAFALSDNRPDPFSGTTRFTLTLPAAADADLGVFDVGGRRVATVHRGRLTAGVSEFAWNGRSDTGARVASGVYFYRATVAGRTLSKKMVVLTD